MSDRLPAPDGTGGVRAVLTEGGLLATCKPDLTRCEVEVIPSYSPFQFGPREDPRRCDEAPRWLATEKLPGEDGLHGRMSMCDRHRAFFEERHPDRAAQVTWEELAPSSDHE